MCPSAVSEVEPYASRGARTVPGGGPPAREAPTRPRVARVPCEKMAAKRRLISAGSRPPPDLAGGRRPAPRLTLALAAAAPAPGGKVGRGRGEQRRAARRSIIRLPALGGSTFLRS